MVKEVVCYNTIRLILKSNPDTKVFIDKEDYDKVKYYSWNIANKGYATTIIKNKYIRLHRYLKNQTDPKIFIDRIDGNVLNNTKKNLRISNCKRNLQNRIKKNKYIIQIYKCKF